MFKLLLSLCLLCLAGTYAAAEAKKERTITVRGCNYVGLEGCRYLGAGIGRVYQLAAGPGVQLPPPNLIITATGTIKPREIGFCSAPYILTASKIAVSKQSCKAAADKK
jgi:hypothetical protein